MTSLNRNYLAAALVAAVGMTVHYVLPEDSPRKGEHRAAVITGAFPDERVNLTVFLDQANDLPEEQTFHPLSRAWSADYDPNGAPGTWHWPEIPEAGSLAQGAPLTVPTDPLVPPTPGEVPPPVDPPLDPPAQT